MHVALAAALAAALSAVIAWVSLLDSERSSKAQTYLDLRDRYFEISKQLPDYRNRTTPYDRQGNKNEWNSIKRYWYHSFDEWIVTQHFNNDDYKELWDLYFKDAQLSVLDKIALRGVLFEMLEKEFNEEKRKQYANFIIH